MYVRHPQNLKMMTSNAVPSKNDLRVYNIEKSRHFSLLQCKNRQKCFRLKNLISLRHPWPRVGFIRNPTTRKQSIMRELTITMAIIDITSKLMVFFTLNIYSCGCNDREILFTTKNTLWFIDFPWFFPFRCMVLPELIFIILSSKVVLNLYPVRVFRLEKSCFYMYRRSIWLNP